MKLIDYIIIMLLFAILLSHSILISIVVLDSKKEIKTISWNIESIHTRLDWYMNEPTREVSEEQYNQILEIIK